MWLKNSQRPNETDWLIDQSMTVMVGRMQRVKSLSDNLAEYQ